ncbi:MAG: hypothetical protein WCI02_17645, partial [Planctomycetota bacterium]
MTIDERKLLNRIVNEAGRVVQVDSWQRSDDPYRPPPQVFTLHRTLKREIEAPAERVDPKAQQELRPPVSSPSLIFALPYLRPPLSSPSRI